MLLCLSDAPGKAGNYRHDSWERVWEKRLRISRAEDILVIRVGQSEGRVGRSWGLESGGRLGGPFFYHSTHSRA